VPRRRIGASATNAWLAGDWIIFTGRRGETQTLWKVQLGPDAKSTNIWIK